MKLCGSKYQGRTCERETGHERDRTLIDREQCRARLTDTTMSWRSPNLPEGEQ
jgi:hypothetical protein